MMIDENRYWAAYMYIYFNMEVVYENLYFIKYVGIVIKIVYLLKI